MSINYYYHHHAGRLKATSKLPSFVSCSEEAGVSDTDLDFSLLVCLGEGDRNAPPAEAPCIWALSSSPWSLPPITGFQPLPKSDSFPFSLMLALTGVSLTFLSSVPVQTTFASDSPLLSLHVPMSMCNHKAAYSFKCKGPSLAIELFHSSTDDVSSEPMALDVYCSCCNLERASEQSISR